MLVIAKYEDTDNLCFSEIVMHIQLSDSLNIFMNIFQSQQKL